MKKNLKKILLTALAIVLVILSVAIVGVSNFLVTYAIGRSGDGGSRQVALEVDTQALSSVDKIRQENRQIQNQRNEDFTSRVTEETVSIVSDDGLTLKGFYYANDNSHDWVITIHGYRGNHKGMISHCERYHSQGFQVLSPDLRGCGESEGDFVGMGWPDRKDILKWIDWIIS